MSLFFYNIFCRYFFTIVLAIIAGIMSLPTLKALIEHLKSPDDTSKHMRLRRLIWTVFIPLILIAMLNVFNIRLPEIIVNEVNIYDDETDNNDGSVIIESHIRTYDLRNTEVLVTAVVEREFKQESDIDYKSNSGPDPKYLTYDGKSGISDTLVIYSDYETSVCRLKIPYKALYHKKGENYYSISITTYYRNNGKWEYLYNKDGFHAYSHTFKNSNLKRSGRNFSKSTAPQVPDTSQQARKKVTEPVPNSLLGITLGDSRATVQNLLTNKGVKFLDHESFIWPIFYFPVLYNQRFQDVKICFDTCGVENIRLMCYIESDNPKEWQNVYEALKEEMTKQYGNNSREFYLSYINYDYLAFAYDGNDGRICTFKNSDTGSSLSLMGDPMIGEHDYIEGDNWGGKIVLLLSK